MAQKYRAEVDIKMRPTKEVRREVLADFVAAFIDAAQNAAAGASRDSRRLTGNNARNIGWAISYPGEADFRNLITVEAGDQEANAVKKKDTEDVEAIVAGASGYSGYLEEGEPYIMPNVESQRAPLAAALHGIIGFV